MPLDTLGFSGFAVALNIYLFSDNINTFYTIIISLPVSCWRYRRNFWVSLVTYTSWCVFFFKRATKKKKRANTHRTYKHHKKRTSDRTLTKNCTRVTRTFIWYIHNTLDDVFRQFNMKQMVHMPYCSLRSHCFPSISLHICSRCCFFLLFNFSFYLCVHT